jgi:ABC-type nickel/cobalt efflux system permease component RcnA
VSGTLLGTLALGFLLGLRHALDADHLVAVSTIVGREKSLWRSSVVGAIWGAGHTVSLLVAAVAVILLKLTISPRVALALELGVGVMLIVLGADLLRRVIRGEVVVHSHPHGHAGDEHAHWHVHSESQELAPGSHHPVGKRPFFVGLVHGLAGSAALMLFVLTTIPGPWMGVLYVVVFGAGTIGGMLVMSTLIGLPFALASRAMPRFVGAVQFAAGLGSLSFGLFYAWRIGSGAGLFP